MSLARSTVKPTLETTKATRNTPVSLLISNISADKWKR